MMVRDLVLGNEVASPETLAWLLAGDPAVRWQVQRDLLAAPANRVLKERKRVATQGWGARFLALQEPSGMWGGGIYSPKWISTTYTSLTLWRLGLPRNHPQTQEACKNLFEAGLWPDGGINFFKRYAHSETCVTGMVLSLLAYFRYPDPEVSRLVDHLLDQQMPDQGWNCQSFHGATHSSFHTTISVLEGLREFEKVNSYRQPEVAAAQQGGREFLLCHRLYKSDKTGQVVHPALTRFSFPPRWHYDVLRALDHFREAGAERDVRLEDAMALLRKKRRKDGCWPLQNKHSGRVFFDMEAVGKPSRINTLRALRVLRWWEHREE